MKHKRIVRWLASLVTIAVVSVCVALGLKYKSSLQYWSGRVSKDFVRALGHDKPAPSVTENSRVQGAVSAQKHQPEGAPLTPASFVPVMALFDETSLYAKGDR